MQARADQALIYNARCVRTSHLVGGRTIMGNGNSRFADSEFVVHVSSDFTVIQE